VRHRDDCERRGCWLVVGLVALLLPVSLDTFAGAC
jgi:hypothetical protein